jgi:hypothetical protein
MRMNRRALPVLISAKGETTVLSRADLWDPSSYSESDIQDLVDNHPQVLPIWQIEPACWPAKSVCRELPLSSGYLDNLLIAPNGNLVLVECKLWRNPEARRKVIAQIIDYAKDLQSFDYERLEQAVQTARGETRRLYEIVAPEVRETDFVEALSRNLERGRLLLLIVGDGITEQTEALTAFLQQHAGIHFTLALVQLAMFDLPNGDRVVVPSVPLQTKTVVRGIVSVDQGKVTVTPPVVPKPATLTEEELRRALERLRAGTSERLSLLLEKGDDLGLSLDAQRTLILRMPLAPGVEVKPLVIHSNGDADTDYVFWEEGRLGSGSLREYLGAVARAIPGASVKQAAKTARVVVGDRPLRVWDVLDHDDEWLRVTREFRERAQRILQASE